LEDKVLELDLGPDLEPDIEPDKISPMLAYAGRFLPVN
jgi:hypothetical protein